MRTQEEIQMRCYNTEAADRWASEQDDIEAMEERRQERLNDKIDAKDKTVLEFLSFRIVMSMTVFYHFYGKQNI